MNKKKAFLLWLTTFALLMLIALCDNNEKQAKPRSVRLTTPMPVASEQAKSFAGVVREAHAIGLGFRTAGQIRKIYVEEGDHIRRGQLIAMLDD